jgi:hypothetical protein
MLHRRGHEMTVLERDVENCVTLRRSQCHQANTAPCTAGRITEISLYQQDTCVRDDFWSAAWIGLFGKLLTSSA